MSGRGFEIRGYRPGDERRILTTFNRVLREECGPRFVDRTLQQWTWQYLDNPEGHRITLAVGEDGTVASQCAGVPVRADTPWGCMRFVHCVDSMTHPEWREGLPAPGLFARTGSAFGDQCLRLGEGLCYGFAADDASRLARQHPGCETMCAVDHLVRDREAAPLTMPDSVVVRRLDDLPAAVDQLCEAMLLDKRCLVRRDRRYLRWRYRDNPDRAAYELWAATGGDQLRGLLVLRLDCGLMPDSLTIVELMAAENDRVA